MIRYVAIAMTLFCGFVAPAAGDDHAELDELYRTFFTAKIDTRAVASNYDEDIIHVSRPGQPLLQGKKAFLSTNIAPLANMINDGQLVVSMRVYIVRRIVGETLANDVGYLQSRIETADGQSQESVQKFSWVMKRTHSGWQVITDFDSTQASPDVLSGPFERIIE